MGRRIRPIMPDAAKEKRNMPSTLCRIDETYIKVEGSWCYYYRAIGMYGATLDSMLSEQRDETA